MGRKPTRKGKHIYLFIAGLILLLPLGCVTVEKTTVQVEVSTATMRTNAVDPRSVKEQERAKQDREVNEHLLRGQKLLIQGDYEGSLSEYKEVLFLSANHPPADKALFNMGLIYAHPRNPKKNPATALSVMQRLMKDYPTSPWAEQAKIWAGVLQENETLKQLIEKSKQVDIGIEEKKREQAR